MKIAYITEFDVKNKVRSSWRKNQLGHWGCCYYIAKYLEDENTTLHYLGPLLQNNTLIPKLKRRLYNWFTNKLYHFWAEPIFTKDYARQIEDKLSNINVDVVLCPDINFVSYLKCDRPIVIWVDSAYVGYLNFYPDYTKLCRESINHLIKMDKLAFKKCQAIIFSSEWAASTAIQTYQIAPAKVKVVPFGANIECNRTVDDIKSIVEAKPSSKCNLLFIGSNWERKGGDVALAVTKILNSMGLDTQLTVVGCKPTIDEPLPKFLKVIGALDTFTSAGLNKINQLFAESHFLILPSKADCTPHVLAEANSFGVPCLTTNVGGIPTMIRDRLNGKTFALDASNSEYCDYISSIITNYSEYKRLALSSFNEYQIRLNWFVACQEVKKILVDMIL
ncbi:glycosyltransferase family 4 protein [Argonema antarcticum]|uniref:glycosyltransferase family 4 protein n=1 Tax=Argonema antarcticum TaxID=2942763 RepID=UPI0020139868|nr:glycosyltransferase family 4 protein [Argonema antarcticum]MCL1471485.1 glycosyltransferase family 4 protein [Argonema antarcticum A004/B2]